MHDDACNVWSRERHLYTYTYLTIRGPKGQLLRTPRYWISWLLENQLEDLQYMSYLDAS